ncbi:stage II sporulation protein M [soil metagenome]
MGRAMNEKTFVERREPEWRRLNELCTKASFRSGDLTPAEFREFLAAYRRTARDLSLARTQSDNIGLIDFLNDLVGRSYGILYRAPARPFTQAILGAVELAAQTFRLRFAFVGAAFLIFVASILFGYAASGSSPDLREFFVPEGMKSSFEAWKAGPQKFEERDSDTGSMMTGFYASNNPKAALVTGAVGAGTFGLLSVFLIYNNGAMTGALAHETASVGNLDFLVSSIIPHGVPEISGLLISGASGLLLGWSLLFPGRRSRAQALREVGKDAMVLLTTSIVMMFIAAPIEGFFSFDNRVSGGTKVAVAILEVIAWASFWTFFGRKGSQTISRKLSA